MHGVTAIACRSQERHWGEETPMLKYRNVDRRHVQIGETALHADEVVDGDIVRLGAEQRSKRCAIGCQDGVNVLARRV